MGAAAALGSREPPRRFYGQHPSVEPSLAGRRGLGWECCRELLAKNSGLPAYARPLQASAYTALYWGLVSTGLQWYLTSPV